MNRTEMVQLCAFRVGSLLCGIPLEHVQEITGHLPMTPVPLAPAVVIGLANLRGQVVTVLDLRQRLHLPARAADESVCNLVVRGARGVISLAVDDVSDVVEVAMHEFESPPRTLNAQILRYVESVLKTDAELLLTLDIETVTAVDV